MNCLHLLKCIPSLQPQEEVSRESRLAVELILSFRGTQNVEEPLRGAGVTQRRQVSELYLWLFMLCQWPLHKIHWVDVFSGSCEPKRCVFRNLWLVPCYFLTTLFLSFHFLVLSAEVVGEGT